MRFAANRALVEATPPETGDSGRSAVTTQRGSADRLPTGTRKSLNFSAQLPTE
jgi:hypothetical protein